LETGLGFKLFDRTGKAVKLNENGKALLHKLGKLVEPLAAALVYSKFKSHPERLQIGYAPSFAGTLLSAAIKALKIKYPGTEVDRHDLSSSECIEGLLAGKLHMAFMVRPARNMRRLDFEKVTAFNRCCAFPSSHRFAGKEFVTPKDIINENFIGFSKQDYPEYGPRIRKLFKPYGSPPRIATDYPDIGTLLDGVEAGDGIAIVSADAVMRPAIKIELVPFRTASEAIVVGVVFPKPKSDVVQAFITAAKTAS
jgi:DNA-binding transcriptional LysR family regulator